ncbi:hypothetical protein PCANC_04381 [Puccinia coronata f. sp. avenae]|uniref:Uncharacterized protein n=1 Tax=Puccinia coronata f. sp. avenae TaxID=200324 RepID=A0A2N5T926_9BASI|nr:hypothetical protein PCANC_04381 [Puccinia coronata f. sp. avenae]
MLSRHPRCYRGTRDAIAAPAMSLRLSRMTGYSPTTREILHGSTFVLRWLAGLLFFAG